MPPPHFWASASLGNSRLFLGPKPFGSARYLRRVGDRLELSLSPIHEPTGERGRNFTRRRPRDHPINAPSREPGYVSVRASRRTATLAIATRSLYQHRPAAMRRGARQAGITGLGRLWYARQVLTAGGLRYSKTLY